MSKLDKEFDGINKKQDKAFERKRRRELDDLRWILGDERGRRFIWRLLEESGFFTEFYHGSERDIFDKGLRSLGGLIHREVIEATDGFLFLDKMYRESLLEEKEAEEGIRD